MGTLLKYLLYALIIVIIYLLGVGFYEGTFNKDSTVGEVTSDVTAQTKQMIKDGYDKTKDAVTDKLLDDDSETAKTGGFVAE
jgi:uncharacterized protein (UPF0333 family)